MGVRGSRYPLTVKTCAVALVRSGRPVADVAAEVGCSGQALRDWCAGRHMRECEVWRPDDVYVRLSRMLRDRLREMGGRTVAAHVAEAVRAYVGPGVV